MSSATRVEGAALRRAEREHGPRPAKVARLEVVAGQVPRDDGDPARVERVDEPPEADGVDHVDGGAVVRRLDPGRPHATRSKPAGHRIGRAVEGGVVDVDPRPEPLEDLHAPAPLGRRDSL